MAEGGVGSDGLERLRQRLLRRPRLTATADLPLKAETIQADKFDLGYRLGPIYDILRHPRTETPLAVAIYGAWGSGKTSAMKWLEARLRDWNDHVAGGGETSDVIKLVPVWFYPWKYQERDDVWRGLIAEIVLATLQQNEAVEQAREQAKQLEFLGRGLKRLISGVKVKVGPATLDLKEVFRDDGPDNRPEADYLNEFETALESWLGANLARDERLIVFIDDLDRCLPKVALQVLEALKLYLNMPRLVFVTGVDRTVINELVEQMEKSTDYLGKMFQIEVTVAPSETEAGAFFDGVLDGNETWAELDDEQRDIFRSVILNLVRRSPREIKRVVNSALIAGEGIEMSSRNWTEGAQPPTLAQGIQVELIRRILRDRFQRETLLGSETGNAFFGRWSEIVRTNPGEEPICEIARVDLDRLRGEGRDSATGDRQRRADTDERLESEILTKIPERWRVFVDQARFRPLLELLTDIDLGNLMRVSFSAEAAEAQREDIPTDVQRIVDEAIARQLEKPVDDLTGDDRTTVTELEIDASDFADARPLTTLRNLKELHLYGTRVADLAPLAGLTNLQTLGLGRTPVADLSPLAGLANLQTLLLDETPVADLTPLAGLANLQTLSLDETLIADLAPLARLTTLQLLRLRETTIADLAPLARLTNLQTIWLGGTQVVDLAPLAGLANLKALGIDRTPVADLAPLAGLANLEALWLNETQVADLAPLAGLANLQELYLALTEVSDEQVKILQAALPKLNIDR